MMILNIKQLKLLNNCTYCQTNELLKTYEVNNHKIENKNKFNSNSVKEIQYNGIGHEYYKKLKTSKQMTVDLN